MWCVVLTTGWVRSADDLILSIIRRVPHDGVNCLVSPPLFLKKRASCTAYGYDDKSLGNNGMLSPPEGRQGEASTTPAGISVR